MHDLLIHTLFYLFSFIAVSSALMVISQNNPVRCVLFLVLTFFASAGLWMIADAEFLSLILVLVYVGAVMTLFLFVVMMLNIDTESLKAHFIRYLPFGLIVVSLFVGLLLVAIPNEAFKPTNTSVQQSSVQGSEFFEHKSQQREELNPALSNTESIGLVLYTDYLLAFELAAVILLVAIVAAITLVHRGAVRSKRQNIKVQIMTKSTDRVHLVRMKSEN